MSDTGPKCCGYAPGGVDCPNPVAHAEQAIDHVDFFCVACVRWGLDIYFRRGYPGHVGFCPDACHKLLVAHGLTPTEQCLDCAQAMSQFVKMQQPYVGSFTRRDPNGHVIEWCCQKMAMTDLARAIRGGRS